MKHVPFQRQGMRTVAAVLYRMILNFDSGSYS